jgi:glucose/arabinose dehydrogenase
MTILSRVFRRVPALIALIALLAVVTSLPASAQQQNMQKYGEPDKEKTPSEKAAEKEAQKAYERSLGNIPAQQSTDPWGIARGDNTAPKTAAKAAPKTASPKVKSEAKHEAKTDSAAKQ